jgi:hypothetical protein
MTAADDWKKTVRRNKLLGMWPLENWESPAGTLRLILTGSQWIRSILSAATCSARKRLLDLFEGAKGRWAETDQELDEWLASPEGKAATAFEVTSVSRWGEAGRS